MCAVFNLFDYSANKEFQVVRVDNLLRNLLPKFCIICTFIVS